MEPIEIASHADDAQLHTRTLRPLSKPQDANASGGAAQMAE